MSRKIKFRAWFRPTQKYKTWIANRYGSEPSGLELNYYTTEDFLDDTWVNTDDYEEPIVFEQYTGLKDKNDKEIYEGDIVKKYDDGDIAPLIGVVEFCKSGARFGVGGGRYILSQRWEIIGNIHENPELLEDEK